MSAERASKEELIEYWCFQKTLESYCFGEECGRGERCPIWRSDGAAFVAELAHLCPHEAVRRAMEGIRDMLRGKPIAYYYYSLTDDEYDEVMREVEERLARRERS